MNRLSGRLAVAALAVAVLSGSAYAGHKIKLRGTFDAPGIDRAGNIDFGATGPATGKLTVNTRSGKVRAIARGRVPNESRRRAKFKTRDVNLFLGVTTAFLGIDLDLDDLPPGNRFKRASYKVSKKGRLKAKAKARLTDETLELVEDLLDGGAAA